MAMHERPALFHVTGIASVDYAGSLHEFRPNRSMWVVAVRAGHLALDNRVVRGLVDLRALLFMTGNAGLGLCQLVTRFIFCHMNRVATGAGNVI